MELMLLVLPRCKILSILFLLCIDYSQKVHEAHSQQKHVWLSYVFFSVSMDFGHLDMSCWCYLICISNDFYLLSCLYLHRIVLLYTQTSWIRKQSMTSETLEKKFPFNQVLLKLTVFAWMHYILSASQLEIWELLCLLFKDAGKCKPYILAWVNVKTLQNA